MKEIHTAALSDQILFPFGLSEGDSIVPPATDGTTPRIELRTAFPFFGMPETALHVSSTQFSLGGQEETTYDQAKHLE